MTKAFTQTLMELRSGAVVEEATNELNTLVAMVRNTGGYQIQTTPRQPIAVIHQPRRCTDA